MWKKPDNEIDTSTQEARPSSRERRESSPSTGAVIGASIAIEGELKGDEDLSIHGRIKGTITLPEHTLSVGQDGEIEATIRARSIVVDGRVRGDLIAQEQIMIRRSGDVRGNITASRVGLEDGAKFKGSIDMDSKADLKHAGKSSGIAPKPTDKSAEQSTVSAKPDLTGAAQSKAHG